jgi:hypothetical protein
MDETEQTIPHDPLQAKVCRCVFERLLESFIVCYHWFAELHLVQEALVSTIFLALLIGFDGLVRSFGGASFLAPTAAALWLALGFGAVGGGIATLWERFLLVRRRTEQLAFHRATYWERLSWKHQRANVLANARCLLLAFALVVACAKWQVSVLPPLLAWLAIVFAGNRRLAESFKADLDAEPKP